MKITKINRLLTGQYKRGYSLKRIYDDLADIYGIAKSPWIFCEFVEYNKSDADFMNEFNKTCFVENIHNKTLFN